MIRVNKQKILKIIIPDIFLFKPPSISFLHHWGKLPKYTEQIGFGSHCTLSDSRLTGLYHTYLCALSESHLKVLYSITNTFLQTILCSAQYALTHVLASIVECPMSSRPLSKQQFSLKGSLKSFEETRLSIFHYSLQRNSYCPDEFVFLVFVFVCPYAEWLT